MRIREKKKAEIEWKQQKIWERRREANRKRVIMERKCFDCKGFRHIIYYCRNREEKELTVMISNRFEVLKSRVIDIEE